jgi:hypothetical protein
MKPWWYNPTKQWYYKLEDVEPWEYLKPVLWRGFWVIADRHLPDGIRQHLVRGAVPDGLIINDAHIIGENDTHDCKS